TETRPLAAVRKEDLPAPVRLKGHGDVGSINHRVPGRSTGVVSTARRKGNQRQWGRPGMAVESRIPNAVRKDGGPSGCRRGSEVPQKPGNAGGGKDPCLWCVCEGGKDR